MSPQNSPDDEIAKLLEIVDRPRQYKQKARDRQIERFIQEVNVKPGKTRVPAYIIYYRYREWKLHDYRTRLAFFRIFQKSFQKTQVFKGSGYLLDPTPFDLTPEGFFKARALLRREKSVQKRKKEKNTKKPS